MSNSYVVTGGARGASHDSAGAGGRDAAGPWRLTGKAGSHHGPFGIWLFHQGVAEGNPLPAGTGLGGIVEEVDPDRGEHQHDVAGGLQQAG
jgi:hypothetical protein